MSKRPPYKFRPRSKCGRANKTSTHHIRPRSRFPDGADVDKDNTVEWDERWHNTYHQCFANLTVEEIHAMIDIMNTVDTCWKWEDIKQLRYDLMRFGADVMRRQYG